MAVYLPEAAVEQVIGPADAIAAAEGALGRVLAGEAVEAARAALPLDRGVLSGSLVSDRGLDLAGALVVARPRDGSAATMLVFDAAGALVAVVAAARLRALAAGAASAVAARWLARPAARTLGVLGCGSLAAAHVECIRAALPGIEAVVVHCRGNERREAFAARMGAATAGYGKEAAEQDVVVTATASRDPVLRGEWLAPGALVCAVGATVPEARELDNAVLQRASFVCCDSLEQARLAAGDLVEPVERGVLDWLEVHPLAELAATDLSGRQHDDDIVLYKGVGSCAIVLAVAAVAVERAGAAGLAQELETT